MSLFLTDILFLSLEHPIMALAEDNDLRGDADGQRAEGIQNGVLLDESRREDDQHAEHHHEDLPQYRGVLLLHPHRQQERRA